MLWDRVSATTSLKRLALVCAGKTLQSTRADRLTSQEASKDVSQLASCELSQRPSHRICRSHEANDTSAGATHRFDKRLLPNEANHFQFAELVQLLDFLKLTGRDVSGVIGFLDYGLQKLRFEGVESVGFEAAILDLIKVHGSAEGTFFQVQFNKQSETVTCATRMEDQRDQHLARH
jgi:hypothetical protein